MNNKIRKTEKSIFQKPLFWGFLYLFSIPIFAGIYTYINSSFVHSTIANDRVGEELIKRFESELELIFDQAALKPIKGLGNVQTKAYVRHVKADSAANNEGASRFDIGFELWLQKYWVEGYRGSNCDPDCIVGTVTRRLGPVFKVKLHPIDLILDERHYGYDEEKARPFLHDTELRININHLSIIEPSTSNHSNLIAPSQQLKKYFPGIYKEDIEESRRYLIENNPEISESELNQSLEFVESIYYIPFVDNSSLTRTSEIIEQLYYTNTGLSLSYGEGFLTMLYFSIVTITTLGYGDILPISGWSKFWVALESLIGVVFIGFFLNAIAQVRRDE